MGWWITLGILFLLAVLPLGVSVAYDANGAAVKVILGPLKITLFPRPKKEKKPKKDPKVAQKKTKTDQPPAAEAKPEPAAPAGNPPAPPAEPAAEKESAVQPPKTGENGPKEEKPSGGGSVADFLPLVKTVLDMLSAFRRRLRVNVLELKVILAGDDPADLGLNYGRAWAAIGNLQPKLEQFLRIKKRKIEVECDFTAAQTLITARLDLTITLGRILATAVVYGVRALIQFLKINKKRKGGAAK